MLLNPVEVVPAGEVGPIHFIAAGGAGMSGIAQVYAELGIPTSGSDLSDSATLQSLTRCGVTTYVGHRPEQIGDANTVVISSAIHAENVELVAARERGLRIWHRSAALAALMTGKRGISITGTHGKTTTTAMTAVMLSEAGADPSYVIGSPLSTTGSSAAMWAGEAFVVEADESDGSFLQYPTEIAVITNVEADHLINWGTPAAYAAGFKSFATLPSVRHIVINIDDEGSKELAEELLAEGREVVRYGEGPDADVRFFDIQSAGNGISAMLAYGGEQSRITLQVPGNHNLANACAAYTVGRLLGLSHDACVEALERFEGTLRRFQLITDTAGIRVFDDYAHHPTEIRAALTAARRAAEAGNEATGLPGRLIACFQPHLFTRTADFQDELGEALTLADVVVVTDIYPSREDPIPGVTGELVADAAQHHGAPDVRYVTDKSELPRALNEVARPGDLVITLGAGDITLVGPMLGKLLAERPEAEE